MARSLSEAEWLLILEQEAAEFLAESVVDEVLQRSQDVLFEKHIESQVLPYAVQFCKKTIENMVEWRFFKCDPGEVDPSVWVAGEEPAGAVIDSWARGMVPLKKAPSWAAASPKQAEKEPSHEELCSPCSSSENSVRGRLQGTRNGICSDTEGALEEADAEVLSKLQALPAKGRGGLQSVTGSVLGSEGSCSTLDRRSRRSSLNKGSRQLKHSVTLVGGVRPRSPKRHLNNSAAEATAAQAAQGALIMEENRKALARIAAAEKEDGRTNYAYDHEGRVILLKKVVPTRFTANNVRARVIPAEEPPPPPEQKPFARGGRTSGKPAPRNSRATPAAATTLHPVQPAGGGGAAPPFASNVAAASRPAPQPPVVTTLKPLGATAPFASKRTQAAPPLGDELWMRQPRPLPQIAHGQQ